MNVLRFFVLSENGQLSVFGLSLPVFLSPIPLLLPFFLLPEKPPAFLFPLTFYLNKAPQPYLFSLKSASFSFTFYLKKKPLCPSQAKGPF